MSWDPIWERVFNDHEWGRYPGESLIRFIAKNFYKSNRADIKILEIGCGAGANLWYLAREGFTAYGIDGSSRAIERAGSFLKSQGLCAAIVSGDASALPYESSFFDAVIDVECLYSNSRPDAEKMLAEVSRVLKQGGLFYSRTVADDMYVGKTHTKVADMEYTDISDGPLVGRGLARLSTRDGVMKMYGKSFTVLSVDSLITTFNNGSEKMSEWNIVCKKQV